MSRTEHPATTQEDTMAREILLDQINTLVRFDETGRGCDEAMALMTRHQVSAAELNARAADTARPIYRPTR